MRFCLLDRITDIQLGKSITATKLLRAEEDYLRDHFPLFPVMPGVLMVEALFQAASHLIRASEDFGPTTIDLVEVRAVKFADFVQPGETLKVEAEITKHNSPLYTIKAQGTKGDAVAVSAKLVLKTGRLFEDAPDSTGPVIPSMSEYCRDMWRKNYQKLTSST
ncbi:MAG: beta-hydroxyacyl-ACP dehydratase [Planctomycetaceae bacterium]|nr:beta-hydroxyacyl-ACP dehydratase [Planctomycetaceae bacterium]MBN8599739.1 beta-hydroxyacyl-ACP dehydratase [Planctomycetota bacterium]